MIPKINRGYALFPESDYTEEEIQRDLIVNDLVTGGDKKLLSAEMGKALKDGISVYFLSDFGALTSDKILETIQNAFTDLSNKCIVFPNRDIDIDVDININDKHNFKLIFNENYDFKCKEFSVTNSSNFKISNLKLKGLAGRYTELVVKGDCHYFTIDKCIVYSDLDGGQVDVTATKNGIHVVGQLNPNDLFSPSFFEISNCSVSNVALDGILVHANCSEFKIIGNTVKKAVYTGIEIEGRTGGADEQRRCANFTMSNNVISDCLDWTILVLWSDNGTVTNNIGLNNFGSALFIGSKDIIVSKNTLGSTGKGFEVSTEFYSSAVETNQNTRLIISENIFRSPSRSASHGVVSIMHSNNIMFQNNIIECLLSQYYVMGVNISSTSFVSFSNNKISSDHYVRTGVLFNNFANPTVPGEVPKTSNLQIRNNQITGFQIGISTDIEEMTTLIDNVAIFGNYIDTKEYTNSSFVYIALLSDSFILIGNNNGKIKLDATNANLVLPNANSRNRLLIGENVSNSYNIVLSIPTTGRYKKGDIVSSANYTAGAYLNFLCIEDAPADGSNAGVWKGINLIQA